MRMLSYWPTMSLKTELFSEMENFCHEVNRNVPYFYDERSIFPACDIEEFDEHYLVSADLPGVKKEDIKIEIREKLLSVSGERKCKAGFEGKTLLRRTEAAYGFFKRSFTLPSMGDADNAQAQYEDGVLKIFIPKVSSARPRKIEITSERESGFFGKLLGTGKTTSTEEVRS